MSSGEEDRVLKLYSQSFIVHSSSEYFKIQKPSFLISHLNNLISAAYLLKLYIDIQLYMTDIVVGSGIAKGHWG